MITHKQFWLLAPGDVVRVALSGRTPDTYAWVYQINITPRRGTEIVGGNVLNIRNIELICVDGPPIFHITSMYLQRWRLNSGLKESCLPKKVLDSLISSGWPRP